MKHILFILLSFALSVQPVFSADKKVKPGKSYDKETSKPILWESEPESIIGIKLGVPLSESMNECPKSDFSYRQFDTKEMCWMDTRLKKGVMYFIGNPPLLGFPISDVTAWVVNGSVESVNFVFDYSDHMKMVELLKSKYGTPSLEEQRRVQNRMGATFDNLVLLWVGKNLTLSFESRASTIDKGAVTIYSKQYSEFQKFNADEYKGRL